jgi:hypothetical protein
MTYARMSILETDISFYDKNGRDISERVKKNFPNDFWEGIGE